jgi:chemotaxis protein methyltransferase CheR
MRDSECVELLQWALPHMRLSWSGFRKVRHQVCKRIDRRRRALGLTDAAAYRGYLGANPTEWEVLRALCSISISRFCRDREVFAALEHTVLPGLAAIAARQPDRTLACWSAGCASGEEPYTLSILWWLSLEKRYPRLTLRVLATDVDPVAIERAKTACYGPSSLKELPEGWRMPAFEPCKDEYRLVEPFRGSVEFAQHDIRAAIPDRHFDLILCRNLVLTYFEPGLQRETMQRILATLHPGGALVVGIHEHLPEGIEALSPWPMTTAVFRKRQDITH